MYTIRARLTCGGIICLSAETEAEALRRGATIAATYLMGQVDHKWEIIAALASGGYQDAIDIYNQAYIAPHYHISIEEGDPMDSIEDWAHHIVEGAPVLVDDPEDGDTWQHSFMGTPVDMNISNDLTVNTIFVLDQDGETHLAHRRQVTPQESI